MEMSRKHEKSIWAFDKSYSLREPTYLKIIHLGSEAEDNCDII